MDIVWFIGAFVVGLFAGATWVYARVQVYQDKAIAALNQAEQILETQQAERDKLLVQIQELDTLLVKAASIGIVQSDRSKVDGGKVKPTRPPNRDWGTG